MALQNAFENLAVESKQLPNNHDVTVTNLSEVPLVDVTPLAKENKQLPDNHNVTVSNIENTPLISGFSTENKQDTIITLVDGIEGSLNTLNANDFATSDKQDTIILNTEEWALNDYINASATVTYIGKQTANGSWLVMKIDSTNGYAVTYATITNNGAVTTYANAWTNKLTLTYNDYATAF